MKSDHEFGLSLLHELDEPPERLLRPPTSAKDLISQVSNFQAILGARMNSCISAYSLDIPVVGLIWNDKLTRFSELTHQRHMYFDESELNAEVMCSKLLDTRSSKYDGDLRQDLKGRTQFEIKQFLGSLEANT